MARWKFGARLLGHDVNNGDRPAGTRHAVHEAGQPADNEALRGPALAAPAPAGEHDACQRQNDERDDLLHQRRIKRHEQRNAKRRAERAARKQRRSLAQLRHAQCRPEHLKQRQKAKATMAPIASTGPHRIENRGTMTRPPPKPVSPRTKPPRSAMTKAAANSLGV